MAKVRNEFNLTLSESETAALVGLLSSYGNLGDDNHPLIRILVALEDYDIDPCNYEYAPSRCGCCVFDALGESDEDDDDDGAPITLQLSIGQAHALQALIGWVIINSSDAAELLVEVADKLEDAGIDFQDAIDAYPSDCSDSGVTFDT